MKPKPRKTQASSNLQSFALNSFVRRTDNTDELKLLIQQHGGELKRKGRSRNWQLNVSSSNIRTLMSAISRSDHSSWQWLVKQLDAQQSPATMAELLALLTEHPDLSPSQLVERSGCDLALARAAIDQFEFS